MDVNVEEQKANLEKGSPSEAKVTIESSSEPVTKKARVTEKDETIPMESETKSKPETSKKEKDETIPMESETKSKPETSKKKDSDEDLDDEPEPPTPGFRYPLEQDSSDMLDEVEFDGHFPSVSERYFTPYYELDVVKPGEDICIRIHSNRICMITIAPSHVIFQENKTIQNCNYKVSEKLDRTKNKVSGKAKHGAQPLQSNSNLCCLTCTDGSSYMVKCCMIGKLVEVNTNLVENPELLKEEPEFGGYIAIVLPNLKHLDKLKEKLLDQAAYEEAIKKRKEKKEQELLEKENDDKSPNRISEEIPAEINIQQTNATANNLETKIKESDIKVLTNKDVIEKSNQDKQIIQNNSSNEHEEKETDMDVDS